jgi:antitoxin component HigA of HigAB toxin-antitoxin module
MKITTKQAYFSAMAEIEGLYQKGFSNLSKDEEERLDLLAKAVEAWEAVNYPMPLKPQFPEIVEYVLKSRNLNQTDLAGELKISKGFLSQLLRGIKSPNTDVLKTMHEKFDIDGNLLLESLA